MGQLSAVGNFLDPTELGLVAGNLKERLASGQSQDLDGGKTEELFLLLA